MHFLIFRQVFTFSSSPLWNSSGLSMGDMDNGMLVDTMQVEAQTLKNILSQFGLILVLSTFIMKSMSQRTLVPE